LSRLNSLDLYRKIHADFTKGTLLGALLSLIGVCLMTSLFVLELNAWLTIDTTTRIVLDSNGDDTMQINFNVTLPNLPCYLSSVDVSDVLGIRKVNITKDIRKWRLNAHGGDAKKVTNKEESRHAERVDGKPQVGYASDDELSSIREEMMGTEDDKIGVIRISSHADFDRLVDGARIAMVNFYAPWCIWSRRLAPVWDYSANLMKDKKYQHVVKWGAVDCTFRTNQDLCEQHYVHAFPTIKVFRNHDAHGNEHYRNDRTPHSLISFVERALDKELPDWRKFDDEMILHMHSEQEKGNAVPRAQFHQDSVVSSTEGCMIAGHVTVKKVPGNFHITGHSVEGFSFVPEKINVTHSISHLSFGSQRDRSYKQRLLLQMAQQQNDDPDQLSGLTFISSKPNTTHEHYLKVVSNELRTQSETVQTYQYSVNSHFYQHPDHISEV